MSRNLRSYGSRLLCVLGWHSWPRWTTRSQEAAHEDDTGRVHTTHYPALVRICRRCRLRQERVAEAREAELRG